MSLVDVSLQFPTIVFTIALGICLVYWAFVLLGALDVDLLGGGHDVDLGGDGLGAGGGHDLGGGHDGNAGGGHDAGHDGDADGGVWHALGLGHVPLTISLSFVVLVAWCASLLGSYYVLDHDGGGLRWLLLPVALVIALPLAAVLAWPLRPIFEIVEGKSNADYVGHVCTVTSNSVDDTFGYANIEDGSSVVQIAIRCDAARKLARGDKALVIEFDPERRLFVVEPSRDVGA